MLAAKPNVLTVCEYMISILAFFFGFLFLIFFETIKHKQLVVVEMLDYCSECHEFKSLHCLSKALNFSVEQMR